METVAAQRRAVARAAQDQAGLRPDHPLAALEEMPTRSDLDTGAAAHRVLRHLHLQGDDVVASMVVFEDGLAARASTAGSRSRASTGQDDVRSHARGDLPPLPPLPRGDGADRRVSGPDASDEPTAGRPDRPGHRPAAQVRLPAAAGRGRRRPAAGRRRAARALDELGIDDVARVRAGQAAGGGLAARRRRPGDPAAHQRGPVPAAAGARRGAPLRHHLPPQQAVQVDDGRRAGRRPRPGRDPAQALLKHFGSVKRLRAATVEEIARCPGIGRRTAEAVVAALAAAAPAAPAVEHRDRRDHRRDDGTTAGARRRRPADASGEST